MTFVFADGQTSQGPLVSDEASKMPSPLPLEFQEQSHSFLLFLGSVMASRATEGQMRMLWKPYEELRAESTGAAKVSSSLVEVFQVNRGLADHLEEWYADPRPAQKFKTRVGEMHQRHAAIINAITGRRLFRPKQHNYLRQCSFFSALVIRCGSSVVLECPLFATPRERRSRRAAP